MTFSEDQQYKFIRLAQQEAEKAIAAGCPPFGVVVVNEAGDILASAHNTASPTTDITCHAEMNLIRQTTREQGRRKLHGCSVFANAAACGMCASALIQAGVRDFYYGAPFESHTNPAASFEQLAHYCDEPLQIHSGILKDECIEQIKRGRKQS